MSEQGIKHLVQCHCILPQFKNAENPVFHKFVVFSIVDSSDTVQPKFAQCNNCGIVHKVVDICNSVIILNKEESNSISSKSDIRISLPKSLSEILDTYDVDIATWEMAEWIYLTKRWNDGIVLARDESIENEFHGKRLVFLGEDRFKIETF